jgi:hypothetical protein
MKWAYVKSISQARLNGCHHKNHGSTITVGFLCLLLSLFASLFCVVIFSCSFWGVAVGWSEVARVVKRALGYSKSTCRFRRARWFLLFLLFLPSTTTKLQSSNVIMSRVWVHCSSAFFPLPSFPCLSCTEGSRPSFSMRSCMTSCTLVSYKGCKKLLVLLLLFTLFWAAKIVSTTAIYNVDQWIFFAFVYIKLNTQRLWILRLWEQTERRISRKGYNNYS